MVIHSKLSTIITIPPLFQDFRIFQKNIHWDHNPPLLLGRRVRHNQPHRCCSQILRRLRHNRTNLAPGATGRTGTPGTVILSTLVARGRNNMMAYLTDEKTNKNYSPHLPWLGLGATHHSHQHWQRDYVTAYTWKLDKQVQPCMPRPSITGPASSSGDDRSQFKVITKKKY